MINGRIMTNDKGLDKYITILFPPLQKKTFIFYCLVYVCLFLSTLWNINWLYKSGFSSKSSILNQWSNLISMMIPKCLDYYGFILSTNWRYCNTQNLYFLKDCFGSVTLSFLIKYRISFWITGKICVRILTG